MAHRLLHELAGVLGASALQGHLMRRRARTDAPIRKPIWPYQGHSVETVKRQKYGAKPTEVDGIRFASQKEARRYVDLKLLERAGEIWDLELQPSFPLFVQSTTGTVRGAAKALAGTFKGRIGEYRGDFAYHDKTGRVVEDVKGFKTPLYKWKRKHVEAQYGITIVEI